MRIAVGADGGAVALVDADSGERLAEAPIRELPDLVRRFEADRPRWVWSDTRRWYPPLLHAGVRVERCHDLRLCGAILAASTSTAAVRPAHPGRPAWLAPGPTEAAEPGPLPQSHAGAALFELDAWDDDAAALVEAGGATEPDAAAVGAEHDRQLALVDGSTAPARLRLLLAAESAGALIGAELHAAGLPWSRRVHEAVLDRELGARPASGGRPARMAALAAEVRAALGAASVNLDSPPDLLRALRAAGLSVDSTSRWALRELDHPAIEPLLAYKKLARLHSANGWAWLDEWIVDGRFRPEYVPGGTATGRWATAGGGALQLPKSVRAAVVADPGWKLVVADAAQLEPRILAAMSRDDALAAVARGGDVYRGIVDARVVETRDQAKVAVLGAMYGATSGDSGRLVPRLARAYPRAMALVDGAARDGERGAVVATLLGRSSPLPPASWRDTQARATQPEATTADERRARTAAREWGRFTRNFVVQGTAAEWALTWMAGLRARLRGMDGVAGAPPAAASGAAFARSPHLVYFLHDELIVHTPASLADEVAEHVVDAARDAGRLLFGGAPVDFPLDVAVVDSYADVD